MTDLKLKKHNIDINNEKKLLSKDFRLFSYLLQIKQVLELGETVSSILEIGIGNGFFAHTMKWLNYDVKTSDINPNFFPDYLGDIRNISIDKTFDMVASFECFQHMPYEDFEETIKKISLLSRRYVFLSLPYYCPRIFSFDLRIPSLPKSISNKIKIPEKFRFLKVLNLGNRKNRKYDEETYNHQAHYWEINRIGYPKSKILKLIHDSNLKCINSYHNFFHPYHYFILCQVKGNTL